MNIITTEIPDISNSNIDESKTNLANKIIKNIHPLFDVVYSDKVSSLSGLKTELQEKRDQVLKKKDELENLLAEYNRKKKIKKLLERISKLVSSGIIYDGALKSEIIILLKIINKLPNNKIDEQSRSILNNITKRFNKTK